MLDLINVSYSYPGQKRLVLNNINMSIENEGITAIMGPNGSGKTTFSKLLVGILTPTSGLINLNKRQLTSFKLAEIGRYIGYVFQNPDKQLFCGTVEEEIGFGLKNLGLSMGQVSHKVKGIMENFELLQYSQQFPLNLSLGEKRRLAIASVLVLEPDLLVLDEPTTGLDVYRKKILGDYLEKIMVTKRGVVIISHDHNFISRYATKVLYLKNGKFIEG